MDIQSYVLAATLPVTRSEAKVYSVNPAKAPSPQSVAAALGVSDPRRVPINYTPETGSIQYSAPPGGQQLPGGAITDEASAIKLAGAFLYGRGFFSKIEIANMTASAKRFSYPPNPPFWSVRLVRTIGGTPQNRSGAERERASRFRNLGRCKP